MSETLDRQRHVAPWLVACLDDADLELRSARTLKRAAEREVWDCAWLSNGKDARGVLSIFKPGPLEGVNTNLPPLLAAEKCALAMRELRALGTPTPDVWAHAAKDAEAAVLCENVDSREWNSLARVDAARHLAHLHALSTSQLSEQLRELVSLSDPREARTTRGQAPKSTRSTLVHGDYFASNLLATRDGICILDWETFGIGDPMWDLGFLIGAERDVSSSDAEAAIAAYATRSPVDRDRLEWHRQSWTRYWRRRSR